ncbi:NHL repeat-containing protein [Pontibacter akesuensis]|uniref:hypothetical protein n=1 Tax=Pontibacter akesuensis TaxID=388950 RepID=UPI00083A1C8F|nr:hypothetical protein [Pontibacter akesuensis]GHA77192.1 hypothetical protein GCM10007389_34030 [Pontibacter akesuensis]
MKHYISLPLLRSFAFSLLLLTISCGEKEEAPEPAPKEPLVVTVAGGNNFGDNDNQLSFHAKGVHVDAEGNVYVSDEANHRVQKWAPGALKGITVAGGKGWGSAANQLDNPWGVFVDKAGNIYVADSRNNRVQK